jgi:hypothetical protein
MKYGSLLIAAVLSLQSGLGFSGVCRSIEYAELKDTPSERLVTIYCEYGKLAGKEQSHIQALRIFVTDFRKLGMHRPLQAFEKDLEATNASAKECIDMQNKISNALKNRSQPAPPSCEGR